ncbi:hypothetical protein AALP_AA3G334800 [Arabis alpina]|uniref:Uncharacterized protein n=1 Tax=Arabis alpina TaxID=50452 RepID=A0A087HDD0_ARAAL|nr:hypothetical protein AALP_AA3G334800 [Arabis alpina]
MCLISNVLFVFASDRAFTPNVNSVTKKTEKVIASAKLIDEKSNAILAEAKFREERSSAILAKAKFREERSSATLAEAKSLRETTRTDLAEVKAMKKVLDNLLQECKARMAELEMKKADGRDCMETRCEPQEHLLPAFTFFLRFKFKKIIMGILGNLLLKHYRSRGDISSWEKKKKKIAIWRHVVKGLKTSAIFALGFYTNDALSPSKNMIDEVKLQAKGLKVRMESLEEFSDEMKSSYK